MIDNKKNEVFFTRKKIFLFAIALIVFALIVFLTSKFLFDINFNTISNLINNSYNTNKLFGLWLFLLFIFPIYSCVWRIIPYSYKLRKRNIFVEWYNWLLFCFVTFFIAGITPFAIGSEPYIIYWLKKRGLSIKEATALVAPFTVLNPMMQVIITWPSFFVICADYHLYANNMKWISCFWLVFGGLIVDLLGTVFWFLLSYSKNIHYWLNLLLNWTKKIFRIKFKTKQEIRAEFKENQAFKKMFIKELKDMKYVLILCFGSLIWNIMYYCEIIVTFNFIDSYFQFNAVDLFNYVNVATTANNFIPIPGAEGSLQTVLIIFIQNSQSNNIQDAQLLSSITNNSVFIWRTFTFYLTTILGMAAIILLIIKEFYKFIVRKTRNKKGFKINDFSIIINVINDKLDETLKSIAHTNYDKKLINVIVVNDPSKKIRIKKKYPNIHFKTINIKKANSLKIIKQIYAKKMINTNLVCIINSGDLISYESLFSINNVYREYDIYANQYKTYINNKLKNKVKPFSFLYMKRFNKKEDMITPNFNFSSFVFRTDLLNMTLKDKTLRFINDIDLYLKIIDNAKNLRYRKKVFTYKYNDKNDFNNKNLTKCFKSLFESNKSIASYYLLKKIVRNKLKNRTFNINKDEKINFSWLPWYIKYLKLLYFNIFIKKHFIILNKEKL